MLVNELTERGGHPRENIFVLPGKSRIWPQRELLVLRIRGNIGMQIAWFVPRPARHNWKNN